MVSLEHPGVASCPQTPLYGGMAEQVDATDLKSVGNDTVPVRFRLPLPVRKHKIFPIGVMFMIVLTNSRSEDTPAG